MTSDLEQLVHAIEEYRSFQELAARKIILHYHTVRAESTRPASSNRTVKNLAKAVEFDLETGTVVTKGRSIYRGYTLSMELILSSDNEVIENALS